MNFFFITFLIFWSTNLFSQEVIYPRKGDSTIVQVKPYYKGCGKIFDNGHTQLLGEFNSNDFFSPTSPDILLAEKIMSHQYNFVMKSDKRVRDFLETDYIRHYFKFYRQYVPMINKQGERVFYLQLFNVCKGKIKKYYPKWDQNLVSPLDEDPCTITIGFVVNLDTQTAQLY